MPNTWVVNASPIILYARIGKLNLIDFLATDVIVPKKVIEEVAQGTLKNNTAEDAVSWAIQYKQQNITVPASVERWDLGPGESQVISFVMQDNYWAVLDDKMARRCINAHGLRMTGSLGIVLRARLKGFIDEARPLLYELRNAGLYVDVGLVEKALNSIGE